MYEANVNFEVKNELVEILTAATLDSLNVAITDGVATNLREKTAYTAGYLAAISIFTDMTTSLEVLKKMSGRE